MRCGRQLQTHKKALQDVQEELRGNARKVVGIEIMRLENTNEGRRASDADSVQQDSTHASCWSGAVAGISTVFEDLWVRTTQFPPDTFRAEVRNLQE